jgi:hypothetical protein
MLMFRLMPDFGEWVWAASPTRNMRSSGSEYVEANNCCMQYLDDQYAALLSKLKGFMILWQWR